MTGDRQVRVMTAADWPAVEAIYRQGIATGNATFEVEPPTWDAFDASKLEVGRLVAVDAASDVLGWIAASPVSSRDVYRGVVEHSVYVAQDHAGHGIGRQLLKAFIGAAEQAGVWMIQSSVFPENTASLALHESVGFRRVGTRERIALMGYGPWADRWRDTVLIERRSQGWPAPAPTVSETRRVMQRIGARSP